MVAGVKTNKDSYQLSCAAGLSLTELLLVLLIISLLAGFSLFYLNTADFRLRSQANNLRSSLQRAKAEAVSKNASAQVQVFADKYQGSWQRSPVHFPEGLQALDADLEPLGNKESTITFTPLGTASNAHLHLQNSQGKYYCLQINSTGRISIHGPLTAQDH